MNQRVFLGLGSNLGESKRNILIAADHLRNQTQCEAAQLSPLYATPPMGEIPQPDYINAVIEIYTSLTPQELLRICKSIETDMGRAQAERWGPRLIDIDILLYGNQTTDEDELCIPHPGLPQRSFVLYPLSDLDSELEVPGIGKVAHLKAALINPEIWPL